MKRDILVIKNPGDLLIAHWKKICEEAIRTRKQFTAALSGGRTPVIFYQRLSGEKNLPWDKTHIFIADERFVPYENEENNYHTINRSLLRHVAIPARNIHPILTFEISPGASAKRYEDDLISWFKITGSRFPRFDLILLGMGEDGHAASLFPGTTSLKETRRLAVAVSPTDKAKEERISITLPVINNAENVIFLVTGKNKANVVKEVIEGENDLLPAALVKPEKGRLLFLLDEAAGSLLTKD